MTKEQENLEAKTEDLTEGEDKAVEVTDPTLAGGTVEEDKTAVEDVEADKAKDVKADDSEDKEDNKDPDVLDDDEPIKNMGELRKVRKRNQSLTKRLSTVTEELEEYKKASTGSSPADLQELETLRAKVAEYTDKENEGVKKAALQEAGLPEEYVELLKGEEEEWKKALQLLTNSKPAPTKKRLGNDSVTNGLKKSNSENLSASERRELLSKHSRRR